jgi:quinol monooxygenase YgiN
MIVVHATNYVREDKVAQFEEATKTYEAQVNANEPGTVIYCMARTRKDPLVYRNVEVFRDRAAIEAHGGTDYFKAAVEATRDCFSAPPVVEICDSLLEH